jgi:hypothetical protein
VFRVALNVDPAIGKPSPDSSSPSSLDEDAAGALLLSLEEGGPGAGSVNVDSEGVPTGSTVLLPPSGAETREPFQPESDRSTSGAAAREAAARKAQGNTSSAAQDILKKYRKGARG